MQVTSDTLFHFTTSLRNLTSILSKKFQLTYCHEKYSLDYETHNFYYPMVSFCDIPLSLAKDQIEKYGSYAIGMTKEWGMQKQLNPVVYIEKDSILAKDIQATMDNLVKMAETLLNQVEKLGTSTDSLVRKSHDKVKTHHRNAIPESIAFVQKELNNLLENLEGIAASLSDYKAITDKLEETGNNSSNLFRYIKNYEGILVRNGKTINNYTTVRLKLSKKWPNSVQAKI